MQLHSTIWSFATSRFMVIVDAVEEYDVVDLSWDESGEVREKISNGEFVVFCARARLLMDGIEVATDYLGQCIYSNPSEFRDHVGSRGKYGSYFTSMVSEVIREGRRNLCNIPKLRCAA